MVGESIFLVSNLDKRGRFEFWFSFACMLASKEMRSCNWTIHHDKFRSTKTKPVAENTRRTTKHFCGTLVLVQTVLYTHRSVPSRILRVFRNLWDETIEIHRAQDPSGPCHRAPAIPVARSKYPCSAVSFPFSRPLGKKSRSLAWRQDLLAEMGGSN
jgi:hypothetical protein